ncbi:MAG: phage baseplate assembly protein V [Sphingorhabdus sp.]
MSGAADMARRLFGMVARAIVNTVDDSRKIQTVQIELFEGEIQDGVERFQNYGLTSRPHAGAEAIGVAVTGNRGHMVVIAVDNREFRLLNLQEGEVALYDDLGQVVHLKRDGIAIESPLKVTIDAPEVTVTTDDATVTAASVTINSDDINLGGAGGQPVARVGDSVSGGVITSGSGKVKAG